MSSRQLALRDLTIGGEAPVRVESMLKIPLSLPEDCLAQCFSLHKVGCELVRVAFPSADLRGNLEWLNDRSPIPLMADIHFDHQLALDAIQNGVHGLRLNPGNIRCEEKVREIAAAAADWKVPIRVGVNAGSVRPEQWAEFPDRSEAMVQLALRQAELLEDAGCGHVLRDEPVERAGHDGAHHGRVGGDGGRSLTPRCSL